MVVLRSAIREIHHSTGIDKQWIKYLLDKFSLKGCDFETLWDLHYFILQPSHYYYRSTKRFQRLNKLSIPTIRIEISDIGFLYENVIQNSFVDHLDRRYYREKFKEYNLYYPLKSWSPDLHRFFTNDEKLVYKILYNHFSDFFPKEIIYEIFSNV